MIEVVSGADGTSKSKKGKEVASRAKESYCLNFPRTRVVPHTLATMTEREAEAMASSQTVDMRLTADTLAPWFGGLGFGKKKEEEDKYAAERKAWEEDNATIAQRLMRIWCKEDGRQKSVKPKWVVREKRWCIAITPDVEFRMVECGFNRVSCALFYRQGEILFGENRFYYDGEVV